VRSALCSDGPEALTQISGMEELLQKLGLSLDNESGPTVTFAMLASSSSIATRSVSAINPRVFIFENQLAEFSQRIVVSYTRGEPYIELMGYADEEARPLGQGPVNFYLIKFDKPCEETQSCVAADFLSDEFEVGWSQVSVYEDLALQDTPLDCLHCHQPYGHDEEKVFLFAEGAEQTMHWFNGFAGDGDPQGHDAALSESFHAVHPVGGGYGVIPESRIDNADPGSLWTMMYLAGHSSVQPVDFRDVQAELDSGGSSETWDSLYQSFVDGQRPPVPFPGPTADDPSKVSEAADVYRSYLDGSLAREDLPDFRHVHDEANYKALGLRAEADQTAEGLLRNACGQCHNDLISPETQKSRFNVMRLDEMPPSEFAAALDRIQRPPQDPLRMPPIRFRSLTTPQVEQLTEYLGDRGAP